MPLRGLWAKPPNAIVAELTKTTGSEVIQAAAKATLTAVGFGAVSDVTAAVLKNTFVVVLSEAQKVQHAIDPLVAHPMMTGLGLLQDAAHHASESADAVVSRTDLLARAHDWFRNARAQAMNEREDYTFVTALDCLAISCHTGRESLALHTYVQMKQDLNLMIVATEKLRAEAADELQNAREFEEWSEHVTTLGKQGIILARRRQRSRAEQLRRKADEAERRLTLLRSLDALSIDVLAKKNVNVDEASIVAALVDEWQKTSID